MGRVTNAWEIPIKNSDAKLAEVITLLECTFSVLIGQSVILKHLKEASLDFALLSRTQTHKGQSSWNEWHTDTYTHDRNNASFLYYLSLSS